ncbi:MAG TPA: hydroxymethylbilane synthase [Chitinophagaceae bacterium]|nr:hydroxymethylbilane synthase [Chitinophagaceae bacterium]HAN37889.1 hydroxymethylbilane synthase [Chitinophagaceae bacterium]
MIKLGTRESELATWQAHHIASLLKQYTDEAIEIVPIKSDGDIDLTTPLYSLGVQGIFTKSLDIALLNKEIDIAVHSYKDVPIQLAEGTCEAAIIERGNPYDLLVCRNEATYSKVLSATKETALLIASSSIRRKAQWCYKYPNTTIENLRGNVNTRLQKLQNSNWDGAIFAAAGLERIGIKWPYKIPLMWMTPAPAQGAIVVTARSNDIALLALCKAIHHQPTAVCVTQERQFLKQLMGGCSTPIAALAIQLDEQVHMHVNITSNDASTQIEQTFIATTEQANRLANLAVKWAIDNNASKLLA